MNYYVRRYLHNVRAIWRCVARESINVAQGRTLIARDDDSCIFVSVHREHNVSLSVFYFYPFQTHAKIWIFFCYSRLEMRCWKFPIKKFNRRMESLRVLSGTWNNNLTYFEKWNIRNSSFLKVCSIERMEFKKLYFEIFRKIRKKCWTGYLKGDEVIKSFVRKIRYDNNWIQLF